MRLARKKKTIACMRCEQTFSSWAALKKHSKSHLNTLKEMKMLQKGQIPDETKEGRGFKGKNKIIVT